MSEVPLYRTPPLPTQRRARRLVTHNLYKGTSLMRNITPPRGHLRDLGLVLL